MKNRRRSRLSMKSFLFFFFTKVVLHTHTHTKVFYIVVFCFGPCFCRATTVLTEVFLKIVYFVDVMSKKKKNPYRSFYVRPKRLKNDNSTMLGRAGYSICDTTQHFAIASDYIFCRSQFGGRKLSFFSLFSNDMFFY